MADTNLWHINYIKVKSAKEAIKTAFSSKNGWSPAHKMAQAINRLNKSAFWRRSELNESFGTCKRPPPGVRCSSFQMPCCASELTLASAREAGAGPPDAKRRRTNFSSKRNQHGDGGTGDVCARVYSALINVASDAF
eukprot:5078031-Pleurochrysis_carterae.AAC.1